MSLLLFGQDRQLSLFRIIGSEAFGSPSAPFCSEEWKSGGAEEEEALRGKLMCALAFADLHIATAAADGATPPSLLGERVFFPEAA